METINIEKTANGFIVLINYENNFRSGGIPSFDNKYVFQTKKALNKFINNHFIFDNETK